MLNDKEIAARLGNRLGRALNTDGNAISAVRTENLDYYLGKPYGNERDGYSQVVTREVLETVEWALPSILRVFLSGDQFVSYDPHGPKDEEQAKQETDIANHYLTQESNGYLAIHHWVKDALLYPNGYIGLWWEEQQRTRVEEYGGISAAGLSEAMMTLAQKGNVEVLEHESETVQTDQGPLETFDVKVRVSWKDKKPRLEAIPPEEMLVDSGLTSLDLDEAPLLARRVRKSYSDLVREGFDQKKLDQISSSSDNSWLGEEASRLFYADEMQVDENEDESMRMFWVHDCYGWMDVDEDGIAEFRNVTMIGADIFDNKEVDYQPYVAMAALLIPHKHTGLSPADIVKDLQLQSSTLQRQLQDNVYKMNIPRKYVGENFISDIANTLDVLLDNTSEYIPARDPMAIQQEEVTPIVASLLPVIQNVKDMQKVRTGVAPELSLDPEVLQQATAGAFANALDQASQRTEAIVRNMAETGFKKLFLKMHQLLREHQDIPKTLRIRGKWVEFNPATWEERSNVSVNVGLGFNRKDAKIAMLNALLDKQQQALPTGLADLKGIYRALDKMVDASGLGDCTEFFNDPSAPGFQPPQTPPDPAVEVAKGDLMLRQQQQTAEHQREMMKMQQEQRKFMADMMTVVNEERRKSAKTASDLAEAHRRIMKMLADQALVEAQTAKTQQEAIGEGLDNNATINGIQELLEASGP